MPNALRSSAPFRISDCGSLSVTNVLEVVVDGRRELVKRFFRVTKRILLNSTFVIMEDMEHAPYLIDNLCQRMHISYIQVGDMTIDDIESCSPKDQKPFAWRDVVDGSKFLLNVQFYIKTPSNKSEVLVPMKAQDPRRPSTLEYSLDKLNHTTELKLCDSEMNSYTIYVSTYTNEFQKVFEVSDEPSKHIFQTEKDKQKEKNANNEFEELKVNNDIEIQSSFALSTVENEEEQSLLHGGQQTSAGSKQPEEEIKIRLEISQINVSLINKKTEVLTMVFNNWISMLSQKKQEMIYEATLDRMQIDNHGQLMPLFPVILKPKCTN